MANVPIDGDGVPVTPFTYNIPNDPSNGQFRVLVRYRTRDTAEATSVDFNGVAGTPIDIAFGNEPDRATSYGAEFTSGDVSSITLDIVSPAIEPDDLAALEVVVFKCTDGPVGTYATVVVDEFNWVNYPGGSSNPNCIERTLCLPNGACTEDRDLTLRTGIFNIHQDFTCDRELAFQYFPDDGDPVYFVEVPPENNSVVEHTFPVTASTSEVVISVCTWLGESDPDPNWDNNCNRGVSHGWGTTAVLDACACPPISSCPEITALADNNTGDVCGNSVSVTYTASVSEGTNGTEYSLKWFVDGVEQTGETGDSFSTSYTITDVCSPFDSPTVTATLVCTDTGEESAAFNNSSSSFTIYPTPDTSTYTINESTCSVNVSDDCGGLTITNDQDGDADYSITSGDPPVNMTFTISHPGAPAACELEVPYTLSCCPVIGSLTHDSSDACHTGSDISVTYTASVANATNGTEYTLKWFVDGTEQTGQTGDSFTTSFAPADACTPLTPTVTVTLVCTESGAEGAPFSAAAPFTIYPTPDASTYTLNEGVCTVSVTDDCGFLTITNDQDGDADYSLVPGDLPVNLTFTLSHPGAPAGCSLEIPHTLSCCPVITGLTDDNSGDVCYDGTSIDITHTVTTSNGTNGTEYTLKWFVDGTEQTGETGDSFTLSLDPVDGCTPLTPPVVTATIICSETGEESAAFGNTSGTYTIYPTPMLDVDYSLTDEECAIGVTDLCGSLMISNDQGGGATHTIGSGDPDLPVNFTISSDANAPAGCEVIENLTAICCPTLTNVSTPQESCSGEDIPSISMDINSSNFDMEYVYFASQQTDTGMYTGGTSLGTVTPPPGGGTVTLSNLPFPANATQTPVTYYVYTILAAPLPSNADCRPFLETTVTVNPLPIADPATVQACDLLDSTGDFILTDADAIVDALGGNTVTYHATQSEADSGTGALSTPYNSVDAVTLYARVENQYACYATSELTLELLSSPEVFSEIIEECDLGNGTGEYDLSGATTYHATEADAEAGANALPTSYSSSPGIIWSRSESTNGCVTVAPYELVVVPLPPAMPADLHACDIGDGTADFSFEDAIADLSTDVTATLSFHASELGAVTNADLLTSPYNSSGGETIYVRIESEKGCLNFTELTLIYEDLPIVNNTTLESCDIGDGTADFMLMMADDDIRTELTDMVSYHPTIGDAEAGTMPIASPFNNGGGVIYARIESIWGCVSTAELSLVVLPLPEAQPAELSECDSGDGTADFTLTDADPLISTEAVSYHATMADADANMNALADPFNSGSTILFARVTGENGCHIVVDLTLTVIPLPNIATVTMNGCLEEDGSANYFAPDYHDDIDVDGDNTVTFHASMTEAEAGIPILDDYFNTNATEVYARVTDEFGCYSTTPITLSPLDSPIVGDAQLEECDKGDGTAEFDLSGTGDQAYYLTQADALAEVNDLPVSYVSGPAIIWSRVNSTNDCFTLAQVVLEILPLPEAPQTVELEECSSTADADFTLAEATNVLDPTGVLTISYHATAVDALNGNAPLSDPYNATDGTLIFALIEGENGCEIIAEITLTVHPDPSAADAEGETCAEEDGTGIFMLSDFDAFIDTDGGNTVSYHVTSGDATAAANALTSPYNTAGGVLYARVETEKGCYVVSELELTVLARPLLDPSELLECDLGDGTAEFDLSAADYYTSEADALAEENALADVYLSTGETIWIRVNSTNGCFDIEAVTLTVLPLPQIGDKVWQVCAYPNQSTDVLLSGANEFIGATTTDAVSYHLTPADVLTGTNAVNMLTSLNVDDAITLFVRVESDAGCMAFSQLTLVGIDCCETPVCIPSTLTKISGQ